MLLSMGTDVGQTAATLRIGRPDIPSSLPLTLISIPAYQPLAYYKPIFPNLPQSEASRHLTILWHRDPFKAKWALIAAAYSLMRDSVGKQNAPLSSFLALVCPAMGIVDHETYLRRLNWTCSLTNSGTLAWAQIPDPELGTFDREILYSAMTVDDVVEFCAGVGYISRTSFTSLKKAHRRRKRDHGSLKKVEMLGRGLLVSGPITLVRAAPAPAPAPSPSAMLNPSLALVPVPIKPDGFVSGTRTQATLHNNQEEVGPLQWTGSMLEVYHPAEGSADFERLLSALELPSWNQTHMPSFK
ncbi:hypothetical protein EG329_007234 [Mollisiaceae sp. DMI_Dod_QoI]|nr:hypothetical protein EG329_007234 [Helotiales sp. DMI_Dod_QoI]